MVAYDNQGRVIIRGKVPSTTMSQTAALYITAVDNAARARTSCGRHYHLGQRDAFEAIFRACMDVDDPDAESVARGILAAIDGDERSRLMDSARVVLRARRDSTFTETLQVV